MAATVEIRFEKQFTSQKSPADTLAYLSDLKTAIPQNFPGLESFEERAPGVYHWAFEKIRHSGYEFQVRLTTAKHVGERTLDLSSVPDPKSSPIEASWRVSEDQPTRVHFKANLKVDLPIPSLLRAVAAPLAQRELSKFFDRYTENVQKTLAA